jgi:hypothetical protein
MSIILFWSYNVRVIMNKKIIIALGISLVVFSLSLASYYYDQWRRLLNRLQRRTAGIHLRRHL